MDETGNPEDAALSLSDCGPLRQVRDPGGLESEGNYPQERKHFERVFAAHQSDERNTGFT